MIIVDMGSGNTCRNQWLYAKKMIDALAKIDPKRKCIIKWQLFQKAGDNIPLHHSIFSEAYWYAKDLGYQTTSSVFDIDSLNFLLTFKIPFVKIANRRDLDWLIGEVPRKIPIFVSVGSKIDWILARTRFVPNDNVLSCVSKYPATIHDYEEVFGNNELFYDNGLSDHTTDWTLYRKYQPEIYEVHFVLEHDNKNLDGGAFARTPSDLKDIL